MTDEHGRASKDQGGHSVHVEETVSEHSIEETVSESSIDATVTDDAETRAVVDAATGVPSSNPRQATLPDATLTDRATIHDPSLADSGRGPVRATLTDVDSHPLARTDSSELRPVSKTDPDDLLLAGRAPEEEEEDGEYRDDPPPNAEATKKKRRGGVLIGIIGGLLFVALAGPLVFYLLIFRYRPTAVKHIPEGTNLAVRIDAKELYLFAPFRDNVLAAIDGGEGKARLQRLKKLSGIDLRSDLREVVIASPDGKRFVLMLGGYFHESRFGATDVLKGIHTFLDEEGVKGVTEKDDALILSNGYEIGQSEDSTVIIASDDAMLKAAMQPSDEWTNLGLVGSGALSFVVDDAALSHLKSTLNQFEDSAVLAHTTRIAGFLTLGAKPTVSMELLPKGADPEMLSKEAEKAIGDAQLLAFLLPDNYGEKRALASAKSKPRTESVLITADWPYEGLESGMKKLGESISSAFPKKD